MQWELVKNNLHQLDEQIHADENVEILLPIFCGNKWLHPINQKLVCIMLKV